MCCNDPLSRLRCKLRLNENRKFLVLSQEAGSPGVHAQLAWKRIVHRMSEPDRTATRCGEARGKALALAKSSGTPNFITALVQDIIKLADEFGNFAPCQAFENSSEPQELYMLAESLTRSMPDSTADKLQQKKLLSDIYASLGLRYERSGNKEEALKTLRKLVEIRKTLFQNAAKSDVAEEAEDYVIARLAVARLGSYAAIDLNDLRQIINSLPVGKREGLLRALETIEKPQPQ
jgi:tetratricopeptide (TPR) repeat protein